MILGIDPGREKIGLAVVAGARIVWRKIVAPAALQAEVAEITHRFPIEKIALGNSTASQKTRLEIEAATWIPIEIVDEKNSTLEARALYFQEKPPRGLGKLVPLSMQTPGEPIDDFAAAVIALRAAK